MCVRIQELCESRWASWAVRPNEPSGFRGRKDLLNRASALVTTKLSLICQLTSEDITSNTSPPRVCVFCPSLISRTVSDVKHHVYVYILPVPNKPFLWTLSIIVYLLTRVYFPVCVIMFKNLCAYILTYLAILSNFIGVVCCFELLE